MKRIVYFLLCVTVFLFCVCLTSCESSRDSEEPEVNSSAQEEKDDDSKKSENESSEEETDAPEKGHWELTDKTCEANRDLVSDNSKTVYSVTQTSHTLSFSYADEEDVLNGEEFQGSYVCTSTEMPEKYYPGDTVSITLTAEALSYSNTERVSGIIGTAVFQSDLLDAFLLPEKATKGSYDMVYYKVSAGNTDQTEFKFVEKADNTFSLVLKEEYAGLDHFWVVFRTDAGESVWEYSWKKD